MDEVLKLNSQAIYDKKFTKDVRGYDAYEVDAFLDDVIRDYENFERFMAENDSYVKSLESRTSALERQCSDLRTENQKLNEESRKLEIQLASANNRMSGIKESDHPTAENLRYIKRIRELESFLRDQGFTENDLKAYTGKE